MDDSGMSESARISPTAYLTGHVWYRNGLSSRAFYTLRGHAYFAALQPVSRLMSLMKEGISVEDMLLHRHLLIDYLLDRLIRNHGIRCVVEIAAGRSPRGWRFKEEFGDRIRYIEADLPAMAEHKRRILGDEADGHRIVAADVTACSGPLSVRQAVEPLIGDEPVVFITEGLIHYFPRETVIAMWRTFSSLVEARGGAYLSHALLPPDPDLNRDIPFRVFRAIMGRFTRGETYMHFKDREGIIETLMEAGFRHALLHDPADYADCIGFKRPGKKGIVRVLEAS